MTEKRIMRRSTASPPVKSNGGVSKRVAPRATNGDEDEAYDPVVDTDHGDEGTDTIRGGWGASQETIDSTSNYAQNFKPTKDAQVIKILDARPYASFRRHWIDRVGIGKRAYVCLQSVGKDCPLCDVGDKPGAVTAFNIALCSDDGQPVLKSWDCGVKLTQQLRTFNNDPKIGPLDKRTLYFAVSKSEAQQRQQVSTMVVPIRERDLEEDWKTPPLTDTAIERIKEKAYTVDIIQMPRRAELEEVAAELTGEDAEKPWGGD